MRERQRHRGFDWKVIMHRMRVLTLRARWPVEWHGLFRAATSSETCSWPPRRGVDAALEALAGKERIIVHCALSQQRGPKCARRWGNRQVRVRVGVRFRLTSGCVLCACVTTRTRPVKQQDPAHQVAKRYPLWRAARSRTLLCGDASVRGHLVSCQHPSPRAGLPSQAAPQLAQPNRPLCR